MPSMSRPAVSVNKSRASSRSGETADSGGPVEPDLATRDGLVDIGEFFETSCGADQLTGGLGGDVDPPGGPFLEGPVTVTQGDLTPVQFPQRLHLPAPDAGDDRLVFEQLLLEGLGGGGRRIHTRNLSAGCDRNRD